MSDPAGRIRQAAAAAGIALLILLLAVVLLSVALSPASNWTVRIALAGFCVLAVARPDVAVLVTTALTAFGMILANVAGVPPLRVSEVLVVASIAGYGVRALPRGSPFRRALTRTISAPVVLFAIAAVASAVVWQRVYQFGTAEPAAYFRALGLFLSRDYFFAPGDFLILVPAAVILEGLALYVVAAALCRMDTTFFGRALRMLAVGGAGVAVLSAVRLTEILLRNPAAIQAMRATSVGLRISPQIADYIAAGSYFALCWLVSLGIAMTVSRGRLVWLAAASVPLMTALYLTGSRSVIAAALVGLVAPVIIVVRQRAAGRGVAIFAVLSLIIMVGGYRWMVGRDVAGVMAMQSLGIRGELIRAGVRLIESRPLFGVGVDRFYIVARGVASPALRAQWTGRMNPHNDFLRFGGELGLIGLGLFLWILAAAGRRIVPGVRTARDARLAGLAGGLVAFIVTSFVSNPLMVREVSYAFWIALGLAVGYSTRLQAPSELSDDERLAVPPSRASRVRWAMTLLLGGVLIFSVPSRVRTELAALDFQGVSYGLFDWDRDVDGTLSRWSGPRATLFVDGRAQVVEIPLRGATPAGVVQQVEILVDGRLANRISLGSEWHRLRTLLPPRGSSEPRRIDLVVSPSWVPADVIPGNQDRRVLGVRVGEVKIVMAPTQGR